MIKIFKSSNSEKLYMLQGTALSPGVILCDVFSIISLKSIPLYKPIHYSNVIFLNSLEQTQVLKEEMKLLSLI